MNAWAKTMILIRLIKRPKAPQVITGSKSTVGGGGEEQKLI